MLQATFLFSLQSSVLCYAIAMPKKKWTYRDAGVDIEAGKTAVEAIRGYVKRTYRPEVMTEIGGFSGLFHLGKDACQDPVLVSSTDGVGTKLKLAQHVGKHDTVGIDLVAMCANDVLAMGAEPLFFLDYIACGRLEPAMIAELVKGISDGCLDAGCALIGGETAEMPGLYAEGEYDLAGFAVGIVERDRIIEGSSITAGDVIVGLPSSGLHSNGFSLVNGLFPDPSAEMALAFLNPTRIYVKPVLGLTREFSIHGLAHITGGGLVDNVERLLPEGLDAVIDTSAWSPSEVFDKIQRQGNIETEEMFTVFNMGIGMAIILPAGELDDLQKTLDSLDEPSYAIGSIKTGGGRVRLTGRRA